MFDEMFDKLFKCEYAEMDKKPFDGFKFEGINCGWLGIGFYKEGQGIGLDFDECIYDPVPEMVKMCLKLKMNESFSFFLPYIIRGMSSEVLDDNKVKFLVWEGWEKEKVYYEQVFDRCYCIDLLEKLFEDLLVCEYYPKQYPFFSELDENEYGNCIDEATEYCVVNGIDDSEEYESKLVNEKVHLYDSAIERFEKYDLMLRKQLIPNGW